VESANRTVKGLEQTIVQTWNHGEDVYSGFVYDDEEKMLRGARGIAKAAAVATLTVGTFEFIDVLDGDEHVQASAPGSSNEGVYHSHEFERELNDNPVQEENIFIDAQVHMIETINEDLEGTKHDVTGVPFERDTVLIPNGDVVSGVYPTFDVEYSTSISESLFLTSDAIQFHAANEQLSIELQGNSELLAQFTFEQIEQIHAGETPDGYVWHHHQEPGRLELVDEQIHAQTGHSGGRSLWGGGSEYR
jgi:hypothetical protein